MLYEHSKRLLEKYTLHLFSLAEFEDTTGQLESVVTNRSYFPFRSYPLFDPPFGRLNQGVRWINLLRLNHTSRIIAHSIDQWGASKAYIHNCLYANAPILLQYIKTPSIYYCHETNRAIYETSPNRPYNRRQRWQEQLDKFDPLTLLYRSSLQEIERNGLKRANVILANSEYTRSRLHELYQVDAEVCYPGVNAAKFSPLNLPKADYVFSVGVLSPNKGFDFIIEGLALIPQRFRPKLVIACFRANTQERQYIMELAEAKHVELTICPSVTEKELIETYNQAICTIFTPIQEPFGLVPLESMACGTPVIGIREGGVQETILDGETGRLVDRIPEQLAEAVNEIIQYPKKAKQMGDTGHGYVAKEWNWEKSTAILERHL